MARPDSKASHVESVPVLTQAEEASRKGHFHHKSPARSQVAPVPFRAPGIAAQRIPHRKTRRAQLSPPAMPPVPVYTTSPAIQFCVGLFHP